MAERPLTVAWFSYFPVEWLSDMPELVTRVPRQHPASWQRVLLAELEKRPELRLHILVLRKYFERNFNFERNGVKFHLIKTPGGLRAPSLFWVDTILIRRVLRAVKPDVVHAWGMEQGAALVANRLGYPHVATVQGLLSWYIQSTMKDWHTRLASHLEDYTLSSHHTGLVTSEARFSVQYLRNRFPRLQVEQVEHAPDPLFHQVVRKPQMSPVRFIFVGQFDYRKGGDLLVRALDQVKNEINFELLAIGKPKADYLRTLQAATSSEFWQRVTFKDQLTHLDVAQELSRATMMICPTRADVSPNAVKEAVVAGLPVIGTAVGGIPDYVFPGRNGVLCAPDNLTELIGAIREACQHPQFARGEVENSALTQTRAYLSPQLMGEKFLGIYQRLQKGRG